MDATLRSEINLGIGRERLAHSLARLDELVRVSIQTIENLKQGKQELEQRLIEVTQLLDHERSNSEQRERLYASSEVETEERKKLVTSLSNKCEEQELLLREQLETIGRLESEVSNHAGELKKHEEIRRDLLGEITSVSNQSASTEVRIKQTASERDEYKNMLYQREREDAAWALKLTSEQRDAATGAIDELISRVEKIELGLSTSEAVA